MVQDSSVDKEKPHRTELPLGWSAADRRWGVEKLIFMWSKETWFSMVG
jgi:hypothetical protein